MVTKLTRPKKRSAKATLHRVQHHRQAPAVIAFDFVAGPREMIEAVSLDGKDRWIIRGGKGRQTFMVDVTRPREEILKQFGEWVDVICTKAPPSRAARKTPKPKSG